jgi:non-ribosomal peptide synthetase component F
MRAPPIDRQRIENRRASLSVRAQAALAARLQGNSSPSGSALAIPKRPAGEAIPLTANQYRLWLHQKLNPASTTYHMSVGALIQGVLRVDILEQSLSQLIERHEALRTTFPTTADEPVQLVSAAWPASLDVVDLTKIPKAGREEEIQRQALEVRLPTFDLERGPLIRARLLRLGPAEHVLVLVVHHIVSDGWSVGIILRDIALIYASQIQSKPVNVPPPEVQFGDYAYWESRKYPGRLLNVQRAAWRRALGALPIVGPHVEKERVSTASAKIYTKSHRLPVSLTQEIRNVAQAHGRTLYVGLLAAFAAFLHRYTRQSNFMIISNSANRDRKETMRTVGFFADVLRLRLNVNKDHSFIAYMAEAHQAMMEAYERQDAGSGVSGVGASDPAHVMGAEPLQFGFLFDNSPTPRLKAQGFAVTRRTFGTTGAKFALALIGQTNLKVVSIGFQFVPELFEPATIERMLGHFIALLEGIVADPDRRISELPLLSDGEHQELPEIEGALSGRRYDVARRARIGLAAPALGRQRRPRQLPLSFAQEHLWSLERTNVVGPAYNIPTAIQLSGGLDVGRLEQAFCELVRRHEVLRTRFVAIDGNPVQVIDAAERFRLEKEDLSGLPPQERAAMSRQRAMEIARERFNLERAPPFKAVLLRLSDQEHVAVVVMHHIVSDYASQGILIREIGALYAAFVAGQSSPLPELPIQYVDYAIWQREWLQGGILERQLAYWKEQLSGAPATLNLPVDRVRPARSGLQCAVHEFAVSGRSTIALAQLARREEATVFAVLLATLDVELWQWSGQQDIVVGTPIPGRTHQEVEGLMGFFANTLVLRTDLSGDPSFRELLKRVKEVAKEAYAHQDLPFEKLVTEVLPDRDVSRQPILQVMLVRQTELPEQLRLPGLRLSRMASERPATIFDLSLHVNAMEQGLQAYFEYATDLFDGATIERLADHLRTLLESVAADPDVRISELPRIERGGCQPRADDEKLASCSV